MNYNTLKEFQYNNEILIPERNSFIPVTLTEFYYTMLMEFPSIISITLVEFFYVILMELHYISRSTLAVLHELKGILLHNGKKGVSLWK